jgi:hypothetical protein
VAAASNNSNTSIRASNASGSSSSTLPGPTLVEWVTTQLTPQCGDKHSARYLAVGCGATQQLLMYSVCLSAGHRPHGTAAPHPPARVQCLHAWSCAAATAGLTVLLSAPREAGGAPATAHVCAIDAAGQLLAVPVAAIASSAACDPLDGTAAARLSHPALAQSLVSDGCVGVPLRVARGEHHSLLAALAQWPRNSVELSY